MKSNFVLLNGAVLAILTTFSNCEIDFGIQEISKNCPTDIELGEVSFVSEDIWPLHGQKDFTFVNQKGDEIIFMGSTENEKENNRMIIETICHSFFMLDEQYTYYTSEHLSSAYHMDSYTYLSFTYMINNDIQLPQSSIDTALYESLYVQFNDTIRTTDRGINKYVYLIANDRGNNLRHETIAIKDAIRIIADTTLNGFHYENLICHSRNPGLFYTSEYGVVLLRHKNDWWNLKR